MLALFMIAVLDEKRAGDFPARFNCADVIRRWNRDALESVAEAKLHHAAVALNGDEVGEVRRRV